MSRIRQQQLGNVNILDKYHDGYVDLSGARLTNVAPATLPTDAVNKSYIDGYGDATTIRGGFMSSTDKTKLDTFSVAVVGITTWLTDADCATTGAITLSGAQTIDGFAGTAGSTRVLVWKQANSVDNGMWIMQSGAWTRPVDVLIFGTAVNVLNGTNNGGRSFLLTGNGPWTVGVTSEIWAIYGTVAIGTEVADFSSSDYVFTGNIGELYIGGTGSLIGKLAQDVSFTNFGTVPAGTSFPGKWKSISRSSTATNVIGLVHG